MSFVLEDVAVRISVDPGGAPDAGQAVEKTLRQVGAQAQNSQRNLQELGKGTAFTRRELQALNYTVSDVVASLSSGISPMTILLQQGPQVRDAFGGVGNVLSKVSAAMTGARLAGLGLAGMAIALGMAYHSAWREQREFEDSLAITGNYAGMTAGRFDELAEHISRLNARPIGEVREALQALVSTGAFGPQSIDVAASAVVNLQKFTGQTAQEVVKDFASMGRGVARWAEEHNRQYNFITAAQYSHIRALESEGRTQEAMAVTLQALNDKFSNQTRSLGYLERALESVKNGWSSFMNTVKGIGRDQTLEEKIDAARERLLELRGTPLKYTGVLDAARAVVDSDFGKRLAAQNIAEQEQRVLDLNRERFREQDRATSAAYELQRQQEEIEKLSSGYQNTVLSRDRAFFSRRQAQEDYAREQERLATERQYQRLEITQQEYRARNEARARAEVASKLRALDQEEALERRRPLEKPQDRIAQEGRLAEIDARRQAILKERARLEADIAAGKYAGDPRDIVESPSIAFRQREIADNAATEAAYEERRRLALRSSAELQEINRATTISLIRDERQRGLAQIALEEEQMRKRMDLGALSVSQRKEAEETLAQWRVLRERQLTEQLMPEWQRQLELYADTTRYMREASDEFHKGFIDNGRSAFEEWVTTGQLSTKRLTQFIEQQFAKMFYDRYLASFVNSVFSMFMGSAGGAGNGAGTITGGSGFKVATNHQGGIAGAGMPTRTVSAMHFAQARRYHVGGIAGDEVPAILKRGEEVLTRDDPRHTLNGGQAGMSVTIAPVINGGVSRNELINGMALAADLAVNRVADARRRGNRLFIDRD
jgi:phage-related minor tail protein